MKIFVYGTLKLNQPNHYFLSGKSRFISHAFVPSLKLYDLGAFPAAVMSQDANDRVFGEIFEVHHDKLDFVMHSLDRLEGHPSFYERQTRIATDAQGTHHEVQVYVFLQSVQGSRLMPNGTWSERVVKARSNSNEGEGKQAQGR